MRSRPIAGDDTILSPGTLACRENILYVKSIFTTRRRQARLGCPTPWPADHSNLGVSAIGTMTVGSLFEPETWHRAWDRLREVEAALAITEGDLFDRRLANLEAKVNALQVDAKFASVPARDRASDL